MITGHCWVCVIHCIANDRTTLNISVFCTHKLLAYHLIGGKRRLIFTHNCEINYFTWYNLILRRNRYDYWELFHWKWGLWSIFCNFFKMFIVWKVILNGKIWRAFAGDSIEIFINVPFSSGTLRFLLHLGMSLEKMHLLLSSLVILCLYLTEVSENPLSRD